LVDSYAGIEYQENEQIETLLIWAFRFPLEELFELWPRIEEALR
jgi:hypothetical protein